MLVYFIIENVSIQFVFRIISLTYKVNYIIIIYDLLLYRKVKDFDRGAIIIENIVKLPLLIMNENKNRCNSVNCFI